MTWVRLADDFNDHPKVLAAGTAGIALFVCSLCWSNKQLTDGYIPLAALRRLVDLDDPSRVAARLVEVGLWERAPGGFQIHDYEQYQPSAESVREERRKNAERVRAWREKHAQEPDSGRSNGVTDSVTNA